MSRFVMEKSFEQAQLIFLTLTSRVTKQFSKTRSKCCLVTRLIPSATIKARTVTQSLCMSFVFYYPRQVLYNVLPWICGYNLGISVCDAEWTERELFSDFDMQRSFGSTMTQCEVPQESLADPSLDSKSPPPDASMRLHRHDDRPPFLLSRQAWHIYCRRYNRQHESIRLPFILHV